jgi:diguanylate cyclase (GGDEF)-like protein/PAS domain S-box-containing protein
MGARVPVLIDVATATADNTDMADSVVSPARTSAVLLVLVAAGVGLLGPDELQLPARGVAWVGTGLVQLIAARRRCESVGARTVLAVANVLIGVGWLSWPSDVMAGLWSWPAAVVLAGITLVCVGTVRDAPGDRTRTAVLDGLLAALALALAVATGWLGLQGASIDLASMAVGFLFVWASLATPLVVVVMLRTRQVRFSRSGGISIVSIASLVIAGIGTATVGVGGSVSVAPLGMLWLAGPVLTSLVVASGKDPYVGVPDKTPDATTSSRLPVLLLLVVSPSAVGAIVGGDGVEVQALAASLAAALLLISRIAVSVRFELASARAAADVRFDALLEHSAEVVALADKGGTLFYVSRPVERAFGVPPEVLVGTPARSLIVGEYLGAWTKMLREAGENPGVPVESQLVLADGRGIPRHVAATVVDLCALDGVNAISITVRDITERVRLERELIRRLRLDDLTGLFNRHVITDRVTHVLQRRAAPCALLYLDVNDFKLVNDSYGHAAGDAVLEAIADRIRGVLRLSDTAGRLGGDEFAILLEELTDLDTDVELVASRIHEACSKPIRVADGEKITVRVAIGAALPNPGMTAAELFQAADAAMYVAKREHRGTVHFEQSMSRATDERLRLLQDVGTAVAQGTFEMHYQPIVRLGSGDFTGVEALLRWNHPTLGRVLPHAFLDHAEASGLTPDLTIAIARKIRADRDRWLAATGNPLHVAMNLSAEQLVRLDAADLLAELTHDGRGDGLTIEVTETSMLGDIAAVAQTLKELRSAGCEIAIDDFGTGHASIGYLRSLPVDFLKIDREFVMNLRPADADRSFAATIHRLALDLSLQTVAEGIETQEEHDAAHAIGCALGQGYLFGRPMSMAALIDARGSSLVVADTVEARVV